MGRNGGKVGAPIAVSDAMVATSDGTRAAPANLPPPHLLQSNSKPFALKRLTAQFGERRIAYASAGRMILGAGLGAT